MDSSWLKGSLGSSVCCLLGRGCSRVLRTLNVAYPGRKSWTTPAKQAPQQLWWCGRRYALSSGRVGTRSLRSASPAASSIRTCRPHFLCFWWVTSEGADRWQGRSQARGSNRNTSAFTELSTGPGRWRDLLKGINRVKVVVEPKFKPGHRTPQSTFCLSSLRGFSSSLNRYKPPTSQFSVCPDQGFPGTQNFQS